MDKIQFKTNERIVIELHLNRKIECDFISGNKMSVLVANSIDLTTNKRRMNQQQFYFSEIKNISKLTNDYDDDNDGHVANEKPCSMQILSHEFEKKSFQLHDIERMNWLLSNIVYIVQCDNSYYSAINDLKYQEHVGLRAENEFGRLNLKAPLITICTSSKVYLFDILRMGKVFKELKEILQSELPRKIIFDSSRIVDYLWHKEKCELNGVLDAMVMYFMVRQTLLPISFEKCIADHFNLSNIFEDPPQIDFQIRPLPEEAKRLAAHKCVLLVKLYWHFMHDVLLQPVLQASQQFSDSYSNIDDEIDLMTMLNRRENPVVNDISLNSLNRFHDLCSVFDSK